MKEVLDRIFPFTTEGADRNRLSVPIRLNGKGNNHSPLPCRQGVEGNQKLVLSKPTRNSLREGGEMLVNAVNRKTVIGKFSFGKSFLGVRVLDIEVGHP